MKKIAWPHLTRCKIFKAVGSIVDPVYDWAFCTKLLSNSTSWPIYKILQQLASIFFVNFIWNNSFVNVSTMLPHYSVRRLCVRQCQIFYVSNIWSSIFYLLNPYITFLVFFVFIFFVYVWIANKVYYYYHHHSVSII